MANCPYCNSQIDDSALVCVFCGAKQVPRQTPPVQNRPSAGAPFNAGVIRNEAAAASRTDPVQAQKKTPWSSSQEYQKLAQIQHASQPAARSASGGYQTPQPASRPASGGYQPTQPAARPVQGGYQPPQPAPRPIPSGYQPTQPAARPVQGGYQPPQPAARPASGGYQPPQPAARSASGGYQPTQPVARPIQNGYQPPQPPARSGDASPSPAPPEKKTSRKKLWLIPVAAVLLLALIAIPLFLLLRKTPEYQITFDANGGKLSSGERLQTVKKGESASPPAVERDGYVFDGWNGTYENVQENAVVVAQWTQVFTITFDAVEDAATLDAEAVQVVRAGEMPEDPLPTLAGATFEGWTPRVTAAKEDVTYTARWTYSAQYIHEKIMDSVVEITVMNESGEPLSMGSGFFLDDSGMIATNFHVMEGAYSAEAALSDGTTVQIDSVVSYDQDLDLALVHATISDNPYLTIAQDPVRTGDRVYALGSPFGLTDTFTAGNVTSASRDVDGVNCIQHDVSISPGNSGGPLVNDVGEVVGINTMYLEGGQNLNFSINIHVLDELSRTGSVTMTDFGDATTESWEYEGVDLDAGFYSDYLFWESEPNDSESDFNRLFEFFGYAGELTTSEDADGYRYVAWETKDLEVWIQYDTLSDQEIMGCYVQTMEDFDADGDDYTILEQDPDNAFREHAIIHVEEGKEYLFAVVRMNHSEFSTPKYYAIGCDTAG